MPRLLADAQRLRAAGLSVIPILADGTKRSAVAWKCYQTRRPTPEELQRWFRRADVGLAVIAGDVSEGLEILDFDAPETFTPWAVMVDELAPGLLARLPLVHTPSDGCHVYYRCPFIEGNQKLAQRLNAESRLETLIETRGQGGYVIAPSSPPECHPLHKPYALVQGDLGAIPTITPDERIILLNAARSFNEYVAPECICAGGSTAQPHQAVGDRPGDLFNRHAEWPDLLEPHGWTRVGQRGEVSFWRRPGKQERGSSATTNYAGADLLYVFSTNACPFDHDTAYTKFAAYALLEHGGDFMAAAKALATEGYGTTRGPLRTVTRRPGVRAFHTIAAKEILAWRR